MKKFIPVVKSNEGHRFIQKEDSYYEVIKCLCGEIIKVPAIGLFAWTDPNEKKRMYCPKCGRTWEEK
jgi:hypothetical protein